YRRGAREARHALCEIQRDHRGHEVEKRAHEKIVIADGRSSTPHRDRRSSHGDERLRRIPGTRVVDPGRGPRYGPRRPRVLHDGLPHRHFANDERHYAVIFRFRATESRAAIDVAATRSESERGRRCWRVARW